MYCRSSCIWGRLPNCDIIRIGNPTCRAPVPGKPPPPCLKDTVLARRRQYRDNSGEHWGVALVRVGIGFPMILV